MNVFDIYWNFLFLKRRSLEFLNCWVFKIGYIEIYLYKFLVWYKKNSFIRYSFLKILI